MAQSQREPDHEPLPGAPAWVKAFGAIALVLVVLFVVLHLTGHAPLGHGG
jgi:hypothetical protein